MKLLLPLFLFVRYLVCSPFMFQPSSRLTNMCGTENTQLLLNAAGDTRQPPPPISLLLVPRRLQSRQRTAELSTEHHPHSGLMMMMMMMSFFFLVLFRFLQVSSGACPAVAIETSCRCCSSMLLPPPPPFPPPPPHTELTFTVVPSAGPDVNFEHLLLLKFFIVSASFLFSLIIVTVCYKVIKRDPTVCK
ncbi:uncharacterized protein ABDE67_016599 [Symphorus nematophorus]